MRKSVRVLLVCVTVFAALSTSPTHALRAADGAWINAYRDAAGRLIGESMSSTFAWERLALLGDTFGNRLSGSPALEAAIQWAVDEMKKDGLENVHTEPVKVPHWVRGHESAEIVGADAADRWSMLGLGDSVGTPADGIEAESLVVHSFEELDANGARREGRIVLFNVPFTNYGDTVRFRASGPSRAAALRRGRHARARRRTAPACARRTPARCSYADGSRRFPPRQSPPRTPSGCSACTTAARRSGVRLRMEAQFLPDADSANVVGEIRGRERPDEVVVRRRPHRLVGRRHRVDRRRRRMRGDVGGAAADEEAEPPAAPDGSRRAVDQRGERRHAAASPTAISTASSWRTT